MAEAKSLSDQAYERLRAHIIQRRLKPDAKLDINALQDELGVSRTPILDAITRLKFEGFVSSRQRVGTYVTPLDAESLEEVFEARIMIEQWTVPKVILRLRDEDILRIRARLNQAAGLLVGVTDETFDYARFSQIDQEFHQSLIDLCGNTHIIRLYDSLNAHMQIARAYSLRALARSVEGQAEHEAILNAFAARNVEQARTRLLEHIERSRQRALELLNERGGL